MDRTVGQLTLADLLNGSETPVKFVDPMNPFFDVSILDDRTIVLPRLQNYLLSDRLYLDESTFSDYLDTLLFNINVTTGDFHRVCHVIVSNVQEYFLQLNLLENTIKISSSLLLQISDCLNPAHANYTRLIVIPIKLIFANSKFSYQTDYDIATYQDSKDSLRTAHSNVIIIDNESRTIEFYEPHGMALQHPYGAFNNISDILQNYIQKTFRLYHYTFVNAASICPLGAQNLQSIVNNGSGHCLAWSLYFIFLRILNVNYQGNSYKTTLQTLHEYVTTSYTPVQLDIIIRQFMAYIDTLNLTPNKLLDNYMVEQVSDYILDSAPVETRLRELLQIYFVNAYMYQKEFPRIFEEIVSYRYLPNFSEIFISEMSSLLNNPPSF